jgi:hypothetical protein
MFSANFAASHFNISLILILYDLITTFCMKITFCNIKLHRTEMQCQNSKQDIIYFILLLLYVYGM